MNELITWLRAQLDTDERDAYDAHSIDCAIHHSYPDSRIDCDCGWPERVLRQVQAHRAILDLYEVALSTPPSQVSSFVRGQDNGFRQALEEAIKALVSIYSDRDGYKEQWSA